MTHKPFHVYVGWFFRGIVFAALMVLLIMFLTDRVF